MAEIVLLFRFSVWIIRCINCPDEIVESKWKAYNNLLSGSHQKLHTNVFRIYCLSWNLLGVSASVTAFNLARGSTMCWEIHALSWGEILFQSAKADINCLNSLIDVFLKNLIRVKICGCPINIWQLNTHDVQAQFKSQESESWQQRVIRRKEEWGLSFNTRRDVWNSPKPVWDAPLTDY